MAVAIGFGTVEVEEATAVGEVCVADGKRLEVGDERKCSIVGCQFLVFGS